MARIKLGAILQDIRGQLGDQAVYGTWKSGIHWIRQAATAVHNPNTISQAIVRGLMAAKTKEWSKTLTVEQRGAWNAYATNGFGGGAGIGEGSSLDIIKRNTGKYSGLNAFVMTSNKLVAAGMVPVVAAPIGATPPSMPKNVEQAPAANTVVWVEPDVFKLGAFSVIWAKPLKGREFHPQIIGYAQAGSGILPITSIKGPDGIEIFPLLPVGYKILVQGLTVDTDGTFSGPSNVGVVTIQGGE